MKRAPAATAKSIPATPAAQQSRAIAEQTVAEKWAAEKAPATTAEVAAKTAALTQQEEMNDQRAAALSEQSTPTARQD